MISVIIPVYNVEPYLRKCLDSIVNQTYRDLEILVVDDGSTDGSGAICDSYAEKDERVVVFHTENRGLSAARNLGLDNAKGEWINFLDSDDWMDSEGFEFAISVAEDKKADLVFWGYVKEYENHSIEKHFLWDDLIVFEKEQVRYQLHRRLFGLIGDELSHLEYAYSFDTAWGKLYKAEAIKDKNIRFEDTAVIGTEDALFNAYFMGYANKAVHISKCMNHYRKNINSLTTVFKPSLPTQWGVLYRRMRKYILSNDLPTVFEDALNNRIAIGIVGLGLNILKSQESINQKKRYLSEVICTEEYQDAIKSFDTHPLSMHWKVFFWLVKIKCVNCLYLSLWVMNRIIYQSF